MSIQGVPKLYERTNTFGIQTPADLFISAALQRRTNVAMVHGHWLSLSPPAYPISSRLRFRSTDHAFLQKPVYVWMKPSASTATNMPHQVIPA